VNKPLAGHLAKAGVEAGHVLKEFPVAVDELAALKAGDQIFVTIFAVGRKSMSPVRPSARASPVASKRHHFRSQGAAHGNSVSHQALGSTGMAQDPGRVFPGKKMAGHLGAVKRTQQNLEVVRVDADRQLLLLKGAVPGSKGSDVIVRPAVKAGA
jgi:large subunit ribosomal protein L3